MRRTRIRAARSPPSAASQAVIEFDMDGTVRDVNDNFARVMGYSRAEVVGKHHSMFVEPAYAASAEYRAFWDKLNRGEHDVGSYKRIAKGGREVWIQASYNPITDCSGKPFKVVKYATDITEQKVRNADFEGQLAAIGKSQAVIEFDLDGTIRSVNDNFAQRHGLLEQRSARQAPQHVRRSGHQRQRGVSRVLGQARPRRSRCRHATSASPRAAAKCGCRLPTTRSSTPTAGRSRS